MTILKISFLLTIISISGCVSWGAGSVDGLPSSQVRFVDLNEKKMANTWVELYDDEKSPCSIAHLGKPVAVLNGIALDHGRKDMNMPLGNNFSNESKTETFIRADKPLIFRMGYIVQSVYLSTAYVQGFTAGGTCLVSAKFTPQPTHLYEATYEIKGGKCFLNVFELVKNSVTGDYERVREHSAQNVECN